MVHFTLYRYSPMPKVLSVPLQAISVSSIITSYRTPFLRVMPSVVIEHYNDTLGTIYVSS